MGHHGLRLLQPPALYHPSFSGHLHQGKQKGQQRGLEAMGTWLKGPHRSVQAARAQLT